jgi:uncharacterized Fe-S cluster-containing radical SAM superfamily protein
MKYQRFLKPKFKPFNPLELAKKTEEIVTRIGKEGLERKYTGFYSVPVYRGIATGYAAGCCLRCMYCWSDWSRDFPERFGEFYSPKKAAEELFRAAEQGITYSEYWRKAIPRIYKLRLSGCEPTLGKEHLLSLLKYVFKSKYPLFILETNGLLLGSDRDYVSRLSEFSEKLYVRVSFKAATPESFTRITGAIGKYYELPFRALKWLLDEGIYARAAAMTDAMVMSKEERKALIEKLGEIDTQIAENLEEERIDRYDTTIKRLRAYVDVKFAEKLEEEVDLLKN